MERRNFTFKKKFLSLQKTNLKKKRIFFLNFFSPFKKYSSLDPPLTNSLKIKLCWQTYNFYILAIPSLLPTNWRNYI